jgi:hypothetical protein
MHGQRLVFIGQSQNLKLASLLLISQQLCPIDGRRSLELLLQLSFAGIAATLSLNPKLNNLPFARRAD